MAKYRADFVTNSSSSSFIGVFAKIEDENLAQKTIEDLNLEKYVKQGSEILEEMAHKYFYGFGEDWAGVDLTPDKNVIDPNSKYILWESYGGAGDDDSDFSEYDEDGNWDDYNYDVELYDFSNKEQEIYGEIDKSNGFKVLNDGYGAGRNG